MKSNSKHVFSASYFPVYENSEFYNIIQGKLLFVPNEIEIIDENIDLLNFEDFKKNDLLAYENDASVELRNTATNESLSFQQAAHRKTPFTLYYSINQLEEKVDDLEYFLYQKNFVNAHVYDYDFVTWQSTSDIGTYKAFNRPLANVKIKKDPIFNENVIDISTHYGKRELVSYMWLQASWLMYFGPYFYQFVSKAHLLNFPYAFKITELKNDIIKIQLYDDVHKSESKDCLDKMRLFREWIDMDGLYKKLR